MKKDIHHYCRVYDDFLSAEICEEYIRLYEQVIQNENQKVMDLSVCYVNGRKVCGDCNCMRINPMEYDLFSDLNKLAISKFTDVIEQYKIDVNMHPVQWPRKYGFEELRIKRFLIEGDTSFNEKQNPYGNNNYHGLDYHVDVYSHAHAKRFLCLMIYLNDDFEDGETYFPTFESGVTPKQGSIFLFPPQWTFLHSGNRPLTPSRHMAKYFLMTHTNYIDMSKVNEGTNFSNRTERHNDPNVLDTDFKQLMWPSNG